MADYKKKPTKYEPYTKKPYGNKIKVYQHTIPVSYQVKSSSTGEISEMIQFPEIAPRILNEYRRRYQEYRLKDLTIIYENIFDKPSPTSGGTKSDKIVSYMGRCNKDGLPDDYDSLLMTEGSYEHSVYGTFRRFWHPKKIAKEWEFRQTALELDNFGTFKMKGFTNLVGSLIGNLKCEYLIEFSGFKFNVNDDDMNE
jgi:hypothetical protein